MIDQRNSQRLLEANGASQGKQLLSAAMVWGALRQWWWVAGPVGVLLAAGAVALTIWLFVPQYEATAILEIKPPEDLVFHTSVDRRSFVADQVEFLRSELVLEPALAAVGAQKVPELKKSEDPLKTLQKLLNVRSIGSSSYYVVAYTSSDAKQAANVANEVANKFLERRSDRADKQRQNVASVLVKLKESQTEEVNKLRLQELEKRKDLVLGGGGLEAVDPSNPLLAKTNRLAALENQLASADYNVMLFTAQLQQKQAQSAEKAAVSEKELEKAIGMDPGIQAIQEQIQTNKGKLAQYEQTGKNFKTHPAYRALLAQVDQQEQSLDRLRKALKVDIAEQLAKNAESQRQYEIKKLQNDLKLAEIAKGVVGEQYTEELNTAKDVRSQSLAELGFLQSDLAKSEQVLQLIDDQWRKVTVQGQIQSVNLLRPANVPTIPVERMPWKQVTVFGFGAFCIPFALALLWEMRVRRVSDTTALEQTSHLPVIGEIASLPMRRQGEVVNGHPGVWLFEESVDSLRTGITLSEDLKDARVMAVTSACSQEGKTSISSQLAVSLARATGRSTLVIDGDMRSPDLHVVFDADSEGGLAGLLKGDVTIDQAIVATFSAGLDLLPAGRLHANPHRLVGDGHFKGLLRDLLKRYHYIVIDTPPILSAAESLVMAKAADATLVCAMRNTSRVDQVRRAYSKLTQAGANPVGVVLNGVPTKRYEYAYGKYGYATKR